MARNRETKIELTAYDDLFETDQSREETKLSKIRDIPPLYCPKCKQECLIEAKKLQVTVIKEPDA